MATSVKMGEGYVEIGIRNRIEQGARDIENRLDRLGDKTAKIGAILSVASTALLAAPIAAASKVQESVSKFGTVFGVATDRMKTWSDSAADALGTSRVEMVDMLSSMQDLLVPMGVLPMQASEMSKQMSQLAVDLGSFNNLPTERVFQDMMAAMTGSGEVMKKYGVILLESSVKQELLNMGMDPNTIDNSAKARARLNIIMRGTTAAQGDAIRTADGWANQVKRGESALIDMAGAIGTTLLESLTDYITLAVQAGSVLRDWIDDNKDLVAAATVATAAAGALGVGLIGVGLATKIAAASLGVFITASSVGLSAVTAAWKVAGFVIAAFQLKSAIGAAAISFVWRRSAGLVNAAWSALTSTLSVAFNTATWTAGAAVTAAAWVATAGAIAAAVFGIDAIMATGASVAAAVWASSAGIVGSLWTGLTGLLGTLSVTAAGAWAFGAGLVSAAWAGVSFVLTALTGPAGIVAGLATIVTAAWTAGAGLIGAAWTAVGASFAASGLAGLTAAGIVSAAWSVVGAVFSVLAIEAGVASVVISSAWSVAAAIASLAWSGFTAVLSAALAPASLLTAAAFIASGAWSVAAGIASAAWSVAWAIITAPITPFLVAGAAVVAVMGLMGAAIAALFVSTIDFAGAWVGVKKAISDVVNVVKMISAAVMGALSIGEYGLAAKALWAGLRLAFWEGVAGAIKAFQWLFSQSMQMTNMFFMKLINTTITSMQAFADAIANPLGAPERLIGHLLSLASNPINFDVTTNAAKAAQELQDILAKIESVKSESQKQREADLIKEGSKSPQEIADEKKASINKLEAEGLLTAAEAAKARAAEDAKAAEVAIKVADAYKDKVRAIELEIVALERGADVADRMRLADEGLSDVQIKQIETLKAKKKAIEDAAKAQEEANRIAKEAGQGRVDAVFGKADEFRKGGMSPDEIFKKVMKQIDLDQKSGKIDGEQAGDARKRARGNLDADIVGLKDQGRALAEAMRSPQEKLNAEMKKIADLQGRGFIDEKTALRAEDKARKDFSDETKQNEEKANQQFKGLEDEQKRVGPSATFSGFAAAIIAGPRSSNEKDQLKATREVAKNTKVIAKEAKKDKGGKFK